jgi:lysophospholipase L1-like esterase
MACVPFVKTNGWRKSLEIRDLSFQKRSANSAVSATTKDFIRSPGESLTVEIESAANPVKLLLYGPDGTSGAGGKMGGSGAWCDHFKSSHTLNGKPNAKITYDLRIPRVSREGTYRVVVVDPAKNAAATTRFTVRPKKYADEIRAILKKIKLPKGTRIVFLGDSLTDLFRGRNYVSLIERAVKSKFGSEVEVINAGVGGDNIIKIRKRLKRDVIDKNPTMVFIFEGANDTKRRYKPASKTLAHWAVPTEKYEKAYREVVNELKTKTKAEIIIATCAPADLDVTEAFRKSAETFGTSCNFYLLPDEVTKVVAIQKKIAADNALKIVDTNKHLTEYIKANKSRNAKQFATVDDGVHPSEFGNREIAKAILEYLGNHPSN